MTNINRHILSNALWCFFFLLVLVIFICIVRRRNINDKKSIIGYLLMSIEICYRAFLIYCYYKISVTTQFEVAEWHAYIVTVNYIRNTLIVATILVMLFGILCKKPRTNFNEDTGNSCVNPFEK